jgi:hypothetical protein
MTKQDLIDFIYTPEGKARAPRFKRELLEKNGFTSLIQAIESECESVGLGDAPLTDKIRAYCKNQMFSPTCKMCSTPYRLWSNKHQAWAKYCSQKCIQSDPAVKSKNFCEDYSELVKKRESTMLEKYGVSSWSQTEEHKTAFAKRTKEAWSDTERREQRLEVRKETNLKRYGVSVVSQVPEIMAKALISRKANREKLTEEEFQSREKIRIDSYRKERLSDDVYQNLNDYELIYDLYVTKNFSIRKCADHIGCSTHTIKTALESFGIDYIPRTQTQESSDEIELYEFISSIAPTAIRTYKIGKHLDIFIPELKLGFEYNGVYWHSDAKRDMLYHANKVEHFYSHDIRYVQIWEDDWIHRQDSVKKFIEQILTEHPLPTQYEVVEISQEVFNAFVEDNHIAGTVESDIYFGVLCDGNIASALGVNKNACGNFEITRHVEIHQSLFRAMFEFFVLSYDPVSVHVLGDLEYTDKRDNVYLQNGFLSYRDIEPDFKYYRTGIREAKETINIESSVTGNSQRILRCYDSGKIEYIWKNPIVK